MEVITFHSKPLFCNTLIARKEVRIDIVKKYCSINKSRWFILYIISIANVHLRSLLPQKLFICQASFHFTPVIKIYAIYFIPAFELLPFWIVLRHINRLTFLQLTVLYEFFSRLWDSYHWALHHASQEVTQSHHAHQSLRLPALVRDSLTGSLESMSLWKSTSRIVIAPFKTLFILVAKKSLPVCLLTNLFCLH